MLAAPLFHKNNRYSLDTTNIMNTVRANALNTNANDPMRGVNAPQPRPQLVTTIQTRGYKKEGGAVCNRGFSLVERVFKMKKTRG